MAGVADSAVGAILEIPPQALQDIQRAERYIDSLQITSKRAAEAVSSHWGSTATSGLGAFIQKLADAQNAMKGMSGGDINFNVNTTQATQNISNASKQIDADMRAISNTIQTIAQSFDFSNVEASVKDLINTFGQVESTIRNANIARREFATDDPEVNRINRLIEVLKEYNAQKKKSQEAIDSEQAKSAAKTIASEYSKLTKRLQEVNDAMNKFQAAGGNVNSASFQALQTEWQNIMARRKEIEKMDIAEVNQYRQQMAQSAYQADLSAFIQNEAQKTAEAKKQAEQQSNDRIQAYQKYLNTYQGAMAAADKLGTRGGQWEDTYENRARVIKNLENAIHSLNKADLDYEHKLKSLTDALNKLKQAQKNVADAMKPTKPMVSPQDAINAAKNATSLKQLQDAYKQLREVMNSTHPKSEQWDAMNAQLKKAKTIIDEIKTKMGELNNQSSRTSNVMGQLQGRIAAAFSIGAIMGFLEKMTKVRARFELQRVALGAIIQDTDEANKIFTQVQQMALQSPFTIMGLENATKQIAAFGFETKKLVPTMKMFGDIAAGLGVEIDRLVLVMGHLKARNFLEGTMVRQFTNMGFNVLGELSKYYSELEGKMISVGEVQERVKKKMVSFEDVEEVLHRVTSAGGMFYDMQKKQSESIWGQIQRIKDAYDLMLNDIGMSNEGIIKKILSLIRDAIQNWRKLKPYITAAVVAMGSYVTVATLMKFVPLVLTNIINGFKLLSPAMWRAKKAQDALNASMMKNPIAALISLGLTLFTLFSQLSSQTDKLTESIDRVRSEGLSNMYDLITQYQILANTVTNATQPYEERKKALEELQRAYGDILPAEMLEIDHIRQMKDGYAEAVDAIKAYSHEKIKANIKAEIDTDFTEKFNEWADNFSKGYALILKGHNLISDNMYEAAKTTIKTVAQVLAEEIKSGAQFDDMENELSKRIASALQLDENVIADVFSIDKVKGGSLATINADVSVFSKSMDKYLKKIESINTGIEDSTSKATEPAQKEYKKLQTAVSNYIEKLKDLKQLQDSGKLEGGLIGEKGLFGLDLIKLPDDDVDEMTKQAFNEFTSALTDLKLLAIDMGDGFVATADEINQALNSNADTAEYESYVIEKVLGGALQNVGKWAEDLSENDFFTKLLERWGKEVEQVKFTEIQREIKGTMDLIIKKGGYTAKTFDKIKLDGNTAYSDVRKKAKELSDQCSENIKNITATRDELIRLGKGAAEAQREAEKMHGNGMTLAQLMKQQEAYDSLRKAMGDYDKNTHTSHSDKELKKWKGILKEIESVSTAYEKYRKSYTKGESDVKIKELYSQSFADMGFNISDFYKDDEFDLEGKKKALEELRKIIKGTTDERKKLQSELDSKIGDVQVQIEIKMREDAENKLKSDLDKMIADYELTEEFKKIGVNVDLTYMVGGKPTTLEDIRNEIARLKKEGGDKEDAKNRIKILEDAEKKLTQIELKEQKERLKNYENYLKKMYSDRAQKMIEAYSTMSQMEGDFQKYIQQLESERDSADTTDERKKELTELIATVRQQMNEASLGISKKFKQDMAKADWESFKGSDIFQSMYQDLDTLGKQGIDALIKRLEAMREKLKQIADIDPKAIREITQYIEKLENQKSSLNPFAAFKESIGAAKALVKEYGSIGEAQVKLSEMDANIASTEQFIADLETIIKLQNDGKEIKGVDEETTARLIQLQAEYGDELQGTLDAARATLKTNKEDASALAKKITTAKRVKSDYEKNVDAVNQWKDATQKLTNATFDLVEACGADIDEEWKQFADALIEGIAQAIMLQLQLKMLKVAAKELGVAMNSALGIIGWIATALQVVASLLMAIFAARDKRLQKQIEKLQDEVDALSKAFERLQKSIERAFNLVDDNRLTQQAIDNIEEQKRAYEEMMRLEESKKKTDDEKLKEYQDKIDDLNDSLDELYEKRHEKWGSTDDAWSEANNWVDAWLDSFKESGDGLDALNDKWDEFYENLVKKQAASKVLGSRMNNWVERINKVIDDSIGGYMSEYDIIEAYKKLGEDVKADMAAVNEGLKKVFEYAGIGGGAGELILSDLQKGIQNITEPQAAAIEAYLNSMRFAVFTHTEQLERLIATVQAQYGSGAENPVVTELKGIRGVLDNIYNDLHSVVNSGVGKTYIQVG